MSNHSDKQLVIGITGYARAGKDFVGEVIHNLYRKHELNSRLHSFAFLLKSEMRHFLLENFGIDAFTNNTQEKKIIRPLLIEYGEAKRKVSNGSYWIDEVRQDINKDFCDGLQRTAIITDVRYENEAKFIKEYPNNLIIYVSRYDESGNRITPAHETEANSVAIVRDDYADIEFHCETFNGSLEKKNEITEHCEVAVWESIKEILDYGNK